ncbi:MAG: radical SAM protein [Patescibacteria group bacterium]
MVKKLYWQIAQKNHDLHKSIHDLKFLGIEITNRCNLQCRHCYMNADHKQMTDYISTKQWKKFFLELKKNFNNKIVIQITGGEPLIRSDIFEIIEYIKLLGFKVTLVTNGILLNQQNLPKLKELLTSLCISLDGFANSHNQLRNAEIYDLVLNNIKLAVKIGINDLTIKTTVTKRNLTQLHEFYNLLKETPVPKWHIFSMEPIGRGKYNQDLILSNDEYLELCAFVDQIKKEKKPKIKIKFEEGDCDFLVDKTCKICKHKLCYSGISSCSILSNGDVVPCIQDNRNNLEIQGNITRDDFKDIWADKFQKNRDKKYKFCQNHYFINNLIKDENN